MNIDLPADTRRPHLSSSPRRLSPTNISIPAYGGESQDVRVTIISGKRMILTGVARHGDETADGATEGVAAEMYSTVQAVCVLLDADYRRYRPYVWMPDCPAQPRSLHEAHLQTNGDVAWTTIHDWREDTDLAAAVRSL